MNHGHHQLKFEKFNYLKRRYYYIYKKLLHDAKQPLQVMYSAEHDPTAGTRAVSLLEFRWPLRSSNPLTPCTLEVPRQDQAQGTEWARQQNQVPPKGPMFCWVHAAVCWQARWLMRRGPWAEPRVQVVRGVVGAISPGPFIKRRGKYWRYSEDLI